jgi:transcriptional regulator with XRE-family HTH domain
MSTDVGELGMKERKFGPDSEQAGLGDRLSKAIECANSAAEVARRADIPESTLNDYVKGRSKLPFARGAAIAKATGVRVEWLATGRGPMKSADFPDAEHHLDTGAADQPWVAAARPALERLRQAINDAGGPAAVAGRSGVSIEAVARYLQSPELLSPDLLAIADACQVTLDWVLAGRTITLPEAPADVPMNFGAIAKYLDISDDLLKEIGQNWSTEHRIRWAWDRYLRDIKPE